MFASRSAMMLNFFSYSLVIDGRCFASGFVLIVVWQISRLRLQFEQGVFLSHFTLRTRHASQALSVESGTSDSASSSTAASSLRCRLREGALEAMTIRYLLEGFTGTSIRIGHTRLQDLKRL